MRRQPGHRSPGTATRRPRAHERGFTLVDTLVALAVISIGVVGIVYGFSAITKSAAITQDQAQVEIQARHVADLVRDRSQLMYQACATKALYQTELNAAITVPAGWTYSISKVNLATSAMRNLADATATLHPCGGGLYDAGVQQISVTVTCSPPACAQTGTRSLTRVIWKANT